MYNTIFTVVLAVALTLCAVLGILAERKRRWYFSLSILGANIASAVGSFFLSKLLANPSGGLIYDLLMKYLPEDITAYAGDVASAPQIFSALMAVIIAPVLFIVFFAIARGVIYIVTLFLRRSPSYKAEGANPGGMICGFICGVLVFAVFSLPVFGVFTLANDIALSVSDIFSNNPTYVTVAEITDAAANNAITKTTTDIYGDKVFESLTTTEMGEHELSLTKELDLLTAVGRAVSAFMNEEINSEETAKRVRDISPAFEASSLIPTIIPELLSSINEHWEKGESFHGIEKIDAGGVQPIVDPLINTLGASDYDSIKKDTSTIVEIFAILVENDAIDSATANPLGLMENESLTSSIIFNLLENDHLTSIVQGIAQYGIELLGEQLHLHAHKDALYDEFIKSANTTIPEALANGADTKAPLSTLFDNYGLDVSDDSVSSLAANMNESNITTLLTTEQLTLNNGSVIILSSPEILAQNSILVCTDQITINISDIDDATAESKALAKAIHEVLSITSIISSGNLTDSNSIQKIGPVLDALSSTKIIGATSTEYLIIGIFQSDLVHDFIGLSLVDATDIANTICSKSHSSGYAPILVSVSDTVEVIKLANDETTSKEEFTDKVGTLITNLTPETTEILQKITNKDVIEQKGVREESSENVSNLISNMLENLSSAKVEGMSEEQYRKEAAATSNILNVALSASATGSNKIFADPDDEASTSATSMTATEYVNNVLDSSVISNTLVDAVFAEDGSINENPLNMSGKISEEDSADVISALEERWANSTEEEKTNEENVKKYTAVGYIINIPMTVVDGELIVINA